MHIDTQTHTLKVWKWERSVNKWEHTHTHTHTHLLIHADTCPHTWTLTHLWNHTLHLMLTHTLHIKHMSTHMHASTHADMHTHTPTSSHTPHYGQHHITKSIDCSYIAIAMCWLLCMVVSYRVLHQSSFFIIVHGSESSRDSISASITMETS